MENITDYRKEYYQKQYMENITDYRKEYYKKYYIEKKLAIKDTEKKKKCLNIFVAYNYKT